MSLFDKMLNAMNLGDDDYYDDEFDEEEELESRPSFHRKKENQEPEIKNSSATKNNKITPMRSGRTKGATASTGMEVCVIKPSSYDDAREIGDTLLSGRTVILNMEGLDMGVAQRIIDFMSGTTYALRGNLQKISNFIFVITPASVDISGDLQGIMDAIDLSGIKTGF